MLLHLDLSSTEEFMAVTTDEQSDSTVIGIRTPSLVGSLRGKPTPRSPLHLNNDESPARLREEFHLYYHE